MEGAACYDGNSCTTDRCIEEEGGRFSCEFVLKDNGAWCIDDGNPCTSDYCVGGACIHPPGNHNTRNPWHVFYAN